MLSKGVRDNLHRRAQYGEEGHQLFAVKLLEDLTQNPLRT
jgi:hypothetical protein